MQPEARSEPPTPMVAQYLEIKAANPDCLLFYRMGDFYELFFEDAAVAAAALGIQLTRRGLYQGREIPMAGVPVRSADDYLQKLIALGHRVAVCEQTEDPAAAKARGSKSVVRREVTRLVTPGTITEDTLLDGRRASHLAALAGGGDAGGAGFALAWIDLSTGRFRVASASDDDLASLVAGVDPREVLLPDRLHRDPAVAALLPAGAAVAPEADRLFEGRDNARLLADAFGVATLDGLGGFSAPEIAAAAAILRYVERTQMGARPTIEPLERVSGGAAMAIDAATRLNLELLRSTGGARAGSLVADLDRTATPAGARLLAERLAAPSTDPALVRRWADAVARLVDDANLRDSLHAALLAVPDVLRALSRLALDRGGPRDLGQVGGLLAAADAVTALLTGANITEVAELDGVAADLRDAPGALRDALSAALADALPLSPREGGFVREGYRADLDEARALAQDSRRVIARLQDTYARETGVRALRIKHNNVLGYFVEVNAAQAKPLTDDAAGRFRHRQTLAAAMRFQTPELADLEARIVRSGDLALAIETEVFAALRGAVAAEDAALRRIAHALARLDVAVGNARRAAEGGWVRPTVDDSLAFKLVCGRHPIVETALKRDGGAFVPNDCDLSPPPGSGTGEEAGGAILLLTGPNMAGKSTYLRQAALIAVLAQAGSFVPAEAAHVGIIDALFSRVGASDDLARGRSTFMVEMVETAAILNQARRRALVILDEIGRGTATFDGLSIAWATIEHLHDVNRCRALFATHYHELTALSARCRRLRNHSMAVKEWRGDVVFLHRVREGPADRSYGIQVAKLAGLPPAAVARAREVLKRLEAGEAKRGPRATIDDLPLFAMASQVEAAKPDATLARLDGMDPDRMSPREALDSLYELKRLRTASPD